MTERLAVRPMTPDDLAAACALSEEAGWRNRAAFFDLVLAVPACQPLVGEVDGQIVAMGVATVSPPAGWIGTIVVRESFRGRGFGRDMTVAVCERLRAAGCETLLLIATALGRPVYERLGFREAASYRLLQATHVPDPPSPPAGSRVRAGGDGDLPRIIELDRHATAEDRSAVLRELAARAGTWLLEDVRGLRGFLIESERGYAPIVAPRTEDGLYLLELHRHLAPEGGHARAAIAEQNDTWRALIDRGWQELWRAPRMLLGPDIPWRPDWIWGQISFAMG